MDAECIRAAVDTVREFTHRREVLAADRGNHDPPDTCLTRRMGDCIAVGVEFRSVEMAVCIDPHGAPR
jgi:hypothetical protein